MNITALAGGVGAGKFLRGVVRVVPPEDLTVVVNTGDDILIHGLHVSPDLDSVTYWLAGIMDRERGWGRAGETFRATEELRRLGVAARILPMSDDPVTTRVVVAGPAGEALDLHFQEYWVERGAQDQVKSI